MMSLIGFGAEKVDWENGAFVMFLLFYKYFLAWGLILR